MSGMLSGATQKEDIGVANFLIIENADRGREPVELEGQFDMTSSDEDSQANS